VSRVRVGLEVGETWVFASALGWPEALRNEEELTAWHRRPSMPRSAWHVLDRGWELEDKTAA
jgi:hypothetical protein